MLVLMLSGDVHSSTCLTRGSTLRIIDSFPHDGTVFICLFCHACHCLTSMIQYIWNLLKIVLVTLAVICRSLCSLGAGTTDIFKAVLGHGMIEPPSGVPVLLSLCQNSCELIDVFPIRAPSPCIPTYIEQKRKGVSDLCQSCGLGRKLCKQAIG